MYEVPTKPSGLGLLSWDSWRDRQAPTIERILNSDKRLVIVSAPTGAGKTAIALGAARALELEGKRTTILTHRIQLMEQYMSVEMENPQLAQAKGRSNYPCILPEVNATAAKAPCTFGEPCMHAFAPDPLRTSDCPYVEARNNAQLSSIRVLNYPFFILHATHHSLYKSHLLICDEGHQVDKEILRAAAASLSEYDLRLLQNSYGIRQPKVLEPILARNPHIVAWAQDAYTTISARAEKLRQEGRKGLPGDHREVMQTLGRITQMSTAKFIVIDSRNGGLKFAPALPEEFAQPFLLDHARKVVLLSATIMDPVYWAMRFGLGEEDVEFIDLPSSFPVENRKVYYMPQARTSQVFVNEAEAAKLIKAVDWVISQHWPQKGLVHAVSYKLAKLISERSNFRDFMIVGGADKVEEFKAAEQGVYVSPTAIEGLDFAGDLCRHQVFPKVPWLDRSDPLTAVQMEEIPGFYDYEALSAIVQGAGRGVRSETDYASTWILDSSFDMLRAKTKGIMPSWFAEAIVDHRNVDLEA